MLEPAGFPWTILDGAAPGGYHSTMKLNDKAPAIDLALTALAHPIRRTILERVMKQETRITELAKPFAISLNAVSKHIRILERARLVRRRRIWREHFVSFDPEPLDEVSAWIEKQRKFWYQKLDALEALLRDEDAAAERKQTRKGRAE
jgi:DNA-binding transcriptional ArsR family regulator